MPTDYVPSASGTPAYSGGGAAIPIWVTATAYGLNLIIQPTAPNWLHYKATNGGISGGAQPTWPLIIGNTVTDNTVVWTCVGTAPQGGVSPPITEPVGTDNRTSTSVDNPLNQIADYIAFLLTQGLLPGQTYAGILQPTVAILRQNVANTTVNGYRLLWSYLGATAFNHRVYLAGGGALVATMNCFADAATNCWRADSSVAPATAVYLGARQRSSAAGGVSQGFSVVGVANPAGKSFAGANTWTDDDGTLYANAWDVPIFDWNPWETVVSVLGVIGSSPAGLSLGTPLAVGGGTGQSPIFQRVAASGATPSVAVPQTCFIGVTTNAGGSTLTLTNANPQVGQTLVIKDETGNANTNNITVSPTGGTIDGAATKVINTAFGSLRLYLGATSGLHYFSF